MSDCLDDIIFSKRSPPDKCNAPKVEHDKGKVDAENRAKNSIPSPFDALQYTNISPFHCILGSCMAANEKKYERMKSIESNSEIKKNSLLVEKHLLVEKTAEDERKKGVTKVFLKD